MADQNSPTAERDAADQDAAARDEAAKGKPQGRQGGEEAAKPEPDLVSEGGSFAAGAAYNPNKSSERLGFREAAWQQLFGSMHDNVAGDKYVGAQMFFGSGDARKFAAMKLPAEAVDEANAFVQQTDYDRIAQFAKDRGLVVLTGAVGSGRAATALHLLVVETGRRSIHELHGDSDLSTLSEEPLPRGTGIIIREITARAAAALDEFALRRLCDTLRARGQKLVIGASATMAWGCATVSADHAVDVGHRPEPGIVLGHQLRWRLGASRAAKAEELLGRADVAEVVEEHLGEDRPLADAARLAALLADASGSPEQAAATARLGMATSTEAEFENWFEKLGDEESERDQCYAIALSVLHGLTNEKVAQAGKLLERYLAPETAEARDEMRPKRTFGANNRSRLTKVRAIQVQPEPTSRVDGPAAPVVRFVYRDYPARVLSYVWNEYDEARGGLTGWLRAVGNTPLEDVCIHAGVAVGALAQASYDHLFEEIVQPWALSENIHQQDAAAVALQTIGADARYEKLIPGLLGEWADSGAPESAQATVARVYGGEYGAERIDAAVKALTQLAERDSWPVVRAVALSISELIATKRPGTTERVFTLLGEWTASRKQQLRDVGHFAFLVAAGDLVDQDARGDGSGVKEPIFLQLDRDPRFAPIHRYLWLRTLNSPAMPKAPREVLTAWAESVDEQDEPRRALVRFLGQLAQADQRAGAIVRLLARDWTVPAPHTAAAIAGRFA